MPFRCFLAERFTTTHENKAFDELHDRLQQQWSADPELVVLLGNFLAEGTEIDSAVLRPKGITVLDLKNYGGEILFSENGAWSADGVEVKGGNKRNPFRQLKDNKFALLKFIERQGLIKGPKHNLGHISAAVVFHQDISFDESQIPPTIASWFHVTDLKHIARTLSAITSRELELSVEELLTIPVALGLDEYAPAGSGSPAERPMGRPSVDDALPRPLINPLGRLRSFLGSDDRRRVITVTGMEGTGKHQLVNAVAAEIIAKGRSCSVLAPSWRFADFYAGATSVYSHVFERVPEAEGDQLVYGCRENADPDDHVYVVTDAHLVSDNRFETELFRFGSGRLLADLVRFIDLKNSKRKMILVGDPFQLGRGAVDESALARPHLDSLTELDSEHLQLDMLLSEAPSLLLSNARGLASSISAGVFNRLTLAFDSASCASLPATDDESESLLRELLQRSPDSTKLIAYSNERVNQINARVRDRFFGRSGALAPGDLIHIHNNCVSASSNDTPLPDFVQRDTFATVEHVSDDEPPVIQSLKGREHPIRVDFLRVRARTAGPAGKTINILCLKDYLEGTRPEVSADTLLALRVSAITEFSKQEAGRPTAAGPASQSSATDADDPSAERLRGLAEFLRLHPHLNAARVRFGYALTAHRAQGRKWSTVVADLNTGQGQHSDAFFRWVYTLLTIADGRLLMSSVPTIDPLSEHRWEDAGCSLAPPKFGSYVPFSSRGNFGTHVSNSGSPDPRLAELRRYVEARLAPRQLRIASIVSHQYQEQYTITGADGASCTLALYYGKGDSLSNVIVGKSTPPDFGASVASLLPNASIPDAFVQVLFDCLAERLGQCNASIVGARHGKFKVWYLIHAPDGWVELEADYNANGFFTHLRPQRFSSEQAREAVKTAIGPPCGTSHSPS